ncbi:hypothetical protein [Campylobacter showae]|nr:hypothetical protein [Campylobacter showae]
MSRAKLRATKLRQISLLRHALARSPVKTSASALKQNYAKALPQVAN